MLGRQRRRRKEMARFNSIQSRRVLGIGLWSRHTRSREGDANYSQLYMAGISHVRLRKFMQIKVSR